MSKDGSLSVSLAVPTLHQVTRLIRIVTGGGTGLGLVTANALAENGARVYISGRREGPLKEAARKIEGTTGEIIPIVADASTKEGITSELIA